MAGTFGVRAASLVLLASGCGLAAAGHGAASGATQMSDRVVSPSTVAIYFGHFDDDGSRNVDLLVLWRGTPSWYARGGAHSSSGGGGGSVARSTVTYSGRTLSVAFNRDTSVATVNDHEVPMTDANVLLLDGADADAGPTVAGTRRVESRIEGREEEPMSTLIRRSPELYAFIGCDVPPPDNPAAPSQVNEMTRRMMVMICSQMRAQ